MANGGGLENHRQKWPNFRRSAIANWLSHSGYILAAPCGVKSSRFGLNSRMWVRFGVQPDNRSPVEPL